jgi:hypothetical protein
VAGGWWLVAGGRGQGAGGGGYRGTAVLRVIFLGIGMIGRVIEG